MWSPARLCCLAVMAPALSKADRRPDCLPVALPDPFCATETASPSHRKYKNGEVALDHKLYKFASFLNNQKRKFLMHKGVCRPRPDISIRARCQFDIRKPMIDQKPWLSCVADKLKLKYIMKTNGSSRNMGLSRAYTTLHTIKKANKASSKLRPSPLLHDGNVSSPDLPDTTNSELEADFTITEVVSPMADSPGEVTSSSNVATSEVTPCSVNDQSQTSNSPEVFVDCNYKLLVLRPNPSSENPISAVSTSTNSDERIDSEHDDLNLFSLDSSTDISVTTNSHNERSRFVHDKVKCLYQNRVLRQSAAKHFQPQDSETKPFKDEGHCVLERSGSPPRWSCGPMSTSHKMSEMLALKNGGLHAQRQCRILVKHFQRKLSVPCQRVSSTKISVNEGRGEFLRSERVTKLSANALVKIVRNMETRHDVAFADSEDGMLQPVELGSFNYLDRVDLKKKGECLESALRNIANRIDPELSDDSDDECIESVMKLPTSSKRQLRQCLQLESQINSKALWVIEKILESDNRIRCSPVDALRKCVEEVRLLDIQPKLAKWDMNCDLPLSFNGYMDLNASALLSTLTASLLDRDAIPDSLNNGILDCEDDFLTDNSKCARTMPLDIVSFRRRKLVSLVGLYLSNLQMAERSTVDCDCRLDDGQDRVCVLCTGQYSCIQSIDAHLMTIQDRIALLDPGFHSKLSARKDVPLSIHWDSVYRENEAEYHVFPVLPSPPIIEGSSHLNSQDRVSKKGSAYSDNMKYAGSYLSEKYRNRKRQRKHFFGKWRKYHKRSLFRRQGRVEVMPVSPFITNLEDVPIGSADDMSLDDSLDYMRRRRDGRQYDIDDVIIPYSKKRARIHTIRVKDITIPSWREVFVEGKDDTDDEEDISDDRIKEMHSFCLEEEKKVQRTGAMGGFQARRVRRDRRFDSRTSSGANTPDPVLLFDQSIFEDPPSPAMLPVFSPTDMSSSHLASDDSQPAFGSLSDRPFAGFRKPNDVTLPSTELPVSAYETHDYSTDIEVSDIMNDEYDTEATLSGPSCPPTPEASDDEWNEQMERWIQRGNNEPAAEWPCKSNDVEMADESEWMQGDGFVSDNDNDADYNVEDDEEDDEDKDPEWAVVDKDPEWSPRARGIVLKLAKR